MGLKRSSKAASWWIRAGPWAIGACVLAWLALVLSLPVFVTRYSNHKEKKPSVLVIYVFSGSDPEYVENLAFFVEHGIREDDGCDYVIVIQQGPNLIHPNPLPSLPSNAEYIFHPNACFDIGTVGWVLATHRDPTKYSFFIWLNSSVRGPFLPAYLYEATEFHWTKPLLSKITASVKLVGATISCGGSHGSPPSPHVQTYVVATDSVGLSVLLRKGSVLTCYDSMADTVLHAEIGASAAILEAGFNIDCLMLRYQHVDWLHSLGQGETGRVCNAGMNPLQPGFNDGVSVGPLEVMFVKVKRSMKIAQWPHVEEAMAFTRWLTGSRKEQAARNAWTETHALQKLKDALRRGKDCFDHEFYISANVYDLGFMASDSGDAKTLAWNQFIEMGLFEGRPHLFIC